MSTSEKSIVYVYFWGDLLTLFFTFSLALYFYQENDFQIIEWVVVSGIFLLWGCIGYSRKLYIYYLKKGFFDRVVTFTKSYFILVTLVTSLFLFYNFPLQLKNIIIAFLVGFLIMGLTTNFFIDMLVTFIKKKKYNTVNTLVAGVGNLADRLETHMTATDGNRHIKGFIKGKKEVAMVQEEKVIGKVKDMNQYLLNNQVDEIIIAIPIKPSKKTRAILDLADYHGIRVKYVFDYKDTFGRNCKMTKYGQFEALNVRQLPLDDGFANFTKNTFDFIFASLALLFLSPFFMLIALMIKLDSPGPVFYCPTRIGKGGKPIRIFKFRTMVKNDDPINGTLSTKKNDPRISRLGYYLRKFSIDELPQFINVILGDMSVVGPRPHRRMLNKQFQESEENYMIRHYYKPGITGWAQVNGWRGPTETKEQKQQRTLCDLWYLENWSFKMDLKIIWMTISSQKTHKTTF